jgi:hypothetical protein
MTVLTLALLAGSQPAAPRLAPVHQIGPQSRRQSPHTPCAPLVRTDALTLTWQKADRHKRSAPTSSSHTPWPNPHSACGTAAAPLPAISCLGAFRPPAARARGEVRHCRQPKTCTRAAAKRTSQDFTLVPQQQTFDQARHEHHRTVISGPSCNRGYRRGFGSQRKRQPRYEQCHQNDAPEHRVIDAPEQHDAHGRASRKRRDADSEIEQHPG